MEQHREEMKKRIKRLEAQMQNVYYDNQILKKTMTLILDRLENIEADYHSMLEEEDLFEEAQVFPVQNKNKMVTEYSMLEVA